MEVDKDNQNRSRLDRLRTVALAAGISLFGPVFLFIAISWFVSGKIPRRDGGIDAVDNPLLFYINIAIFSAGALIFMPVSLMFMIGYFRGRFIRMRESRR